MFTTQNPLPLGTRNIVCGHLNRLLADSICLGTYAKQAHWNVKGANFIALHKLFDEVYDAVTAGTDKIAERIVALGGIATGVLERIANTISLSNYPALISDGTEHLKALSKAIAQASMNVYYVIRKLEEEDASDPVTANMLQDIAATLDKYLWFLEAHSQS